jgi:hypothetical protein
MPTTPPKTYSSADLDSAAGWCDVLLSLYLLLGAIGHLVHTNSCITYVLTALQRSGPRVRNPDARDSSPDRPSPGTRWDVLTKPDGSKTHKVHMNSMSGSPNDSELVAALVKCGVLQAI